MSTEIVESGALRQAVAEEIRALLGRRNMSRLQLAKRIDRSHTYMWRRLSGEVAFDLDDLERISAVLGVKIADLLPRPPRGDTETSHEPVTYGDQADRAMSIPPQRVNRRPPDRRPVGHPGGSSRPDGSRRPIRIA